MELSKRLQAVADLVTAKMVIADIGTDHGYIPIYLVESGRCPKAFAMDINEGPLQRAKEHIVGHGLSEQIETHLSDGVQALPVNACDCVIAAGMGGALMIRIMEEGKEVFSHLSEFILQPQSEISKVRRYLCENHFRIVEEDMVLEDGKFYPMMKVKNDAPEHYNDIELRYGKILLERKHPVLKMFLEKEIQTKEVIRGRLEKEGGTHIETRKKELEKEIAEAREAFQVYL